MFQPLSLCFSCVGGGLRAASFHHAVPLLDLCSHVGQLVCGLVTSIARVRSDVFHDVFDPYVISALLLELSVCVS